jgi:hypothetical protein
VALLPRPTSVYLSAARSWSVGCKSAVRDSSAPERGALCASESGRRGTYPMRLATILDRVSIPVELCHGWLVQPCPHGTRLPARRTWPRRARLRTPCRALGVHAFRREWGCRRPEEPCRRLGAILWAAGAGLRPEGRDSQPPVARLESTPSGVRGAAAGQATPMTVTREGPPLRAAGRACSSSASASPTKRRTSGARARPGGETGGAAGCPRQRRSREGAAGGPRLTQPPSPASAAAAVYQRAGRASSVRRTELLAGVQGQGPRQASPEGAGSASSGGPWGW